MNIRAAVLSGRGILADGQFNLIQNKQFAAVLFQPGFGRIGVRGVAADQLSEGRAVVGVGQVAQFVHAHIVGHIFGCAHQPPVEADAGALTADAPEGLG